MTGPTRELIAGGIFLATYFVFAVGTLPGFRIDRTGAAIIGAGLVVVTGVLPLPQAVAAVDVPTLVLLFGMMIVAAYLDLSGFFGLVTAWAIGRARSPLGLLVAVIASAGVLSAFFVNDIVCLVLTPLVIQIVGSLGLRPVPYLIALATASNLGSVATITGNPQNMIVGSLSGIPYGAFLAALGPVAVIGLGLDVLIIAWVYRRELARPLPERPHPLRVTVHRAVLVKSLIVTGGISTTGNNFTWRGVVMVGNDITGNGNNDIQGAVLSALNAKLGQSVPIDTVNGTKTYQYNSCNVYKSMVQVGALVLTLLNQQITAYTEYWPFVLGTILIVLLFLFPGGILGAVDSAIGRFWRRRDA